VDESYSEDLLEYLRIYPIRVLLGQDVPEILLNGHHAKIQAWRKEQARLKTALNRPDLLSEATDKGEVIEAPDDAWL
jgi:tRNA (guanine37-N1)-methyltransferase